jgi:Abnormal spindle-like microcephaly-assoc'd, ASPM-SPD-2-Hydin
VDASFNPNVTGNSVYGAVIQSDGNIIIGGQFSSVGGQPLNHLARLSGDAVTNVLSVPSLSYLTWDREGGAPETSDVWFDLSTDGGGTWTALTGTVSRSPTGWQQMGISLPNSGHIRARARSSSGGHNGSSGIVEKITAFGQPPDIAVLKNGSPIAFGHSHEFGVVGTGSASSSLFLTIQNNGGGPLTGLRDFSLAGSSHFSVSGPTSGTVAAGGSTTLTVIFQPRTTGIHSAILHLNSNDPDTPTFDILLSGTGSLPITTWKQIHFGQTENTGEAADTATNEAGITRLQAYAQNLDPNSATSDGTSISPPTSGFAPFANDQPNNAPPSGSGGFAPEGGGETASESPPPGSVFHFNYQRNKLALADIIFQVEWSESLAPDDWHTDDVTEEVLSDDGTTQQVRATVPAGTAGRRFVRLKMIRP